MIGIIITDNGDYYLDKIPKSVLIAYDNNKNIQTLHYGDSGGGVFDCKIISIIEIEADGISTYHNGRWCPLDYAHKIGINIDF